MPMQAVHEFEAVGRTPVAEQDLGAVRFDFSSNDCRRHGFGVGCLTDAGAGQQYSNNRASSPEFVPAKASMASLFG